VLVSESSYPSEDTFENTQNFCFLLKKLSTSCNIEKRRSLDQKYPELCGEIEKEQTVIQTLDCNTFGDGDRLAENNSLLVN
jgi:hypothetical protein